jgi:hypothetical protein
MGEQYRFLKKTAMVEPLSVAPRKGRKRHCFKGLNYVIFRRVKPLGGIMKLSLALLLLSLPALAAPSLKDNMKSIRRSLNAIKMTVDDRAQNSANAQHAETIATLFKTARDQIPETITSLPAPAQKAAIADYQRLIDMEARYARELKAAFLAQDNAKASGLVDKMDHEKREGHQKYKD